MSHMWLPGMTYVAPLLSIRSYSIQLVESLHTLRNLVSDAPADCLRGESPAASRRHAP